MKRCPQCGVGATDDAVFCEADGARLVGAMPRANAAPPLVCRVCGHVDADDGEGFCSECGHRLQARASTTMANVAALDVATAAWLHVDPAAVAWCAKAPTMSGREYVVALRSLVALIDSFSRADIAWVPRVGDLVVRDDGTLALAQIRVHAERLSDAPFALDVPRVIRALAAPGVPEPVVRTTPALARLLSPAARVLDRSARALRDELANAASLRDGADASRVLVAVSDIGLRHAHNEDAFAVASGESNGDPWHVIVVCDGVSSGGRAAEASAIAAKTACDALTFFARSPDLGFESLSSAVDAAVRAAHLAVCGTLHEPLDQTRDEDLPGTTIVAAFVLKNRVAVGWVGDSRAYWVGAHAADLITTDDSWAAEAVARGELSEDEAMRAPLAHALTKCLGPLEVGETPSEITVQVRAREFAGDGHLLLCSDGLWNDFGKPAAMHGLFRAAGDVGLEERARFLVASAIANGGHDNVTVALYRHCSSGG